MNEPQVRDWRELIATFLLALGAVATAWSSFQATRWHGEQAKATTRTNAIRIDAARAAGLAEAETEIDVATFIQWVDAQANDDAQLADFYRQRFRDEFTPAFDAWFATNPFDNPDAPLTPFAMPEYRVQARAEVDRLDAEAEEATHEVRVDLQRASNYVLSVVLFAVVLFFAGMSGNVRGPGAQLTMVVMGAALFVGTPVWIATFRVSMEI
jgi:hypothetical protein